MGDIIRSGPISTGDGSISRFVSARTTGSDGVCNTKSMKETNFYIRRTWTTFTGKVTKVDHIGPYMENQEFAVAMQRGHDMRRQVPATEQITKWEWVQGKDA